MNVGSGLLVFPAGDTLSAITIPIFDDSIAEKNKVFRVDLESSEATISTASAEVTIIDDDGKELSQFIANSIQYHDTLQLLRLDLLRHHS